MNELEKKIVLELVNFRDYKKVNKCKNVLT